MPASGAQIWIYINRQTKSWLTMINFQITWNITGCLRGCWLVWSGDLAEDASQNEMTLPSVMAEWPNYSGKWSRNSSWFWLVEKGALLENEDKSLVKCTFSNQERWVVARINWKDVSTSDGDVSCIHHVFKIMISQEADFLSSIHCPPDYPRMRFSWQQLRSSKTTK